MKTYKTKGEYPASTTESVDSAVRGLMEELLQGIVKNIPDNPTIRQNESGATTPSAL